LPFKIIGMGSIPVTDNDFLPWREEHRSPGLGPRNVMVEYVRFINGKNKSLFDEQMEEFKTYIMRSKLSPVQWKHLEDLRGDINEQKATISAQKALIETLD
jgi:hypothetical protein